MLVLVEAEGLVAGIGGEEDEGGSSTILSRRMKLGKGQNRLLQSSPRIISSCLKTVSANAGNVASTACSAEASVASSISVLDEDEKERVPNVIDLVIAEFHRTCIYTVPKHPLALDAASQTNEYWKMMGYREKDGKIESTKEFMERVECCMKLYAALIQTEIDGVRNPHGLREGWAWIAMLLNTLPANAATSMALEAFLRMAGHALFRRYKSQFVKVLNVISTRFLPSLKQKQGESGREVVMKLEQYLNDKVYMHEPEGRHLQGSSLSKVFW